MFAETVSQPPSCFTDVELVAGGASYAVDDTAGSAFEVIGNLGGVLRARKRNGVRDEQA